jgi:hypothetical protein
VRTRAEMEKRIRGMANGQEFDENFEELLIDTVAGALGVGITKETIIKIIELMVRVKCNTPQTELET